MTRLPHLFPTPVVISEPNGDATPTTTQTKPRASLCHELSPNLDLGPRALYSKAIQKKNRSQKIKILCTITHWDAFGSGGTVGHRGELSGLIGIYVLSEVFMSVPFICLQAHA